MAPFRVLQLSMVLVMLFGSTWLARLAGLDPAETGVSSTWLSDQAALAGVLHQGDNGDNSGSNNNNANTNNNNANTNNNNSNSNNNSNTNSNNNNSSDDNGNEDSDDNDNFSFDLPPLPTYTSSE